MLYAGDLNITDDYINEGKIECLNTSGNKSNIYIDSTNKDINFNNNGVVSVKYKEESRDSNDGINGVNIISLSNTVMIKNKGGVLGKVDLRESML